MTVSHEVPCAGCIRLLHIARARRRVDRNKIHIVRSWCRVCGLPALLEVVNDYELAKRNLYALDDQPMAHRNIHASKGGWGVHWRFDEVLAAVFWHEEHCWPTPPWYEFRERIESPVTVLTSKEEITEASRKDVDVELRMLREALNRKPRTREELTIWSQMPVWDTNEMAAQFEVLGYKAPFAIVVHKETRERGSVLFQDGPPRLYFGFDPDRVI
jgi:hypothetical protein